VRDDEGEPHHFLIQVQDITDRRSYERQLQHMADHDPLTGLLNRRSFERELKRHVAEIERYGAKGAALVLDLDNFKYYNDTLGHHVGDELIVRMARVLEDRLRETDVLARLGGDEFAVILPKEDVDGATHVAEALLECIRVEGQRLNSGRGKAITASVGIAMFDDEERLTGEEVLVNADLAMYDAKEAGRDRIALYQTEDHAQGRMQGRIKWVDQIRVALDEDGFTLLAQPITNLDGAPCDRYELLLRMNGEDGDLIPPGTFLYIAERLGWVNEIDRWVSRRAIQILADRPDIQLEVNLSGLSIGDDRLMRAVEEGLEETAVDPSRLTFEITETAAVANIAKARAFAERLSELGCQFALDDFGAGFGSFYYLKHLPFDFLKIDGEFVKGCARSKTDRLLIEAVVGIARGMGKRTIAEFVGDEETVSTLRRLGVDFGQGYHLGHPEPLDALLGVPAPQ
jgi:diguanylate cyclase (GGDEF)-like protein